MNIKRNLGIVGGFVFIVAMWFTASFIATENAKAKPTVIRPCCCCTCAVCECEACCCGEKK